MPLMGTCYISTYYLFQGKYYEQVKEAAMGSPLSPDFASIFMESIEPEVPQSYRLKSRCWYRYVEDTFVAWTQGRALLNDFLCHLNSFYFLILCQSCDFRLWLQIPTIKISKYHLSPHGK